MKSYEIIYTSLDIFVARSVSVRCYGIETMEGVERWRCTLRACWNFIPELNFTNFSPSNILLSFPIKKLNSGCSPFHWFSFPLDSLSPHATMKFTGALIRSAQLRDKKKRKKKKQVSKCHQQNCFWLCYPHCISPAFRPLGSESTKRGCGGGEGRLHFE